MLAPFISSWPLPWRKQVHAQWLNNVVDRWALEEIVNKKSPLHEQDLAKLVKDHFSDVLQQIEGRDKMTGEDSSEDDGDSGGGEGVSALA